MLRCATHSGAAQARRHVLRVRCARFDDLVLALVGRVAPGLGLFGMQIGQTSRVVDVGCA